MMPPKCTSNQFIKVSDETVICHNCLSETFVCFQCGRRYHIEDEFEVDSSLCRNCGYHIYSRCDCCGNLFKKENLYDIPSQGRVCYDCLNTHFIECECCHNLYHREYDDIIEDGGFYCYSCTDKDNISARGYFYKPYPIFYKQNNEKVNRFYGVECEVESKTCNAIKINNFATQVNAFNLTPPNNLFYFKKDGSLYYGIELVTHPCSLNFHRDQFPWTDIQRIAIQNGISGKSRRCGLHIHTNREGLSEIDLIKLALFVYNLNNKLNIEKIARRKFNHYSQFKPIYQYSKKSLNTSESRYEAINFTNNETIEFRMFHGTINKKMILASIEFVDSIIKFVKNYSIACIARPDIWNIYIEFMLQEKDKYPYFFLQFDNLLK